MRLLPKRKTEVKIEEKTVSVKSAISKTEIPKVAHPKHFSVKVSEKPNRNELTNILMQLKSKDSLIEMKEKLISKIIKNDKQKVDSLNIEIDDNIIQNIERKLSLLNQL
jgi:hypothetical protein